MTSSNYNQAALQRRLLAGLGIAGGSRGSLTKCVGRLQTLRTALLHNDQVDQARADWQRELQLLQLELTKLVLIVQRQHDEIAAASVSSDSATTRPNPDNMAQQIAATRSQVHELRQRLQRSSVRQRCQHEYETLAKLAMTKHATSTRTLRTQLSTGQADLAATRALVRTAEHHVQIRQAQFQAWMQHLLDLKTSLTEPLEEAAPPPPPPPANDMAGVEQMVGDDESAGKGMERMETDEKDDGEEDEEGELYGDL